jgi:peptidoglycan/xylan/chitin deacetylase (PgdA/CDA1 family)
MGALMAVLVAMMVATWVAHPMHTTAEMPASSTFQKPPNLLNSKIFPSTSSERFVEKLPSITRVVQASPVGVDVPEVRTIELTFNQSVDHKSVEDSFHVFPPLVGTFSWKSKNRLVFHPRKVFGGFTYSVVINGKDSHGKPIKTHSFEFRRKVPKVAKVVPGEGKPIVLTFDDGANSHARPFRLLDILAKFEAKAIFFPTGNWLKKQYLFEKKAVESGHWICNHSATHRNLTTATDDQIREEILGGAGLGSCPLLRPPGMAFSKRLARLAKEYHYHLFLWDIDSRDWDGLSAEDIENLVLARARPEAVVLFHIHGKHTLEALPAILKRLKKANYRFNYEDVEKRIPVSWEEGMVSGTWSDALLKHKSLLTQLPIMSLKG